MKNKTEWNSPDTAPNVEVGAEKMYWLAVENKRGVSVFSALYQNRPLITDSDGEISDKCEDWALMSESDGYISSVGWMINKSHYDYDDFYDPIVFNEEYRLLGWAEYSTPSYP